MALFSGLSVFRTAVIVGIAAVVAYRVRSASFKRTVLTGDGGLFEDSVDNSSERRSFSYRTDADGRRWFVMDSLVRPGMAGALPGKSASPPLHIHAAQQECFLVRRGHFAYLLDGKEGLEVGGTPEAEERVCIPPGRPHTFWNARNTTELDMEVSLEPPLNAEKFFRTVTGLALDYGSLGNAPLPQLLSTFVGGGVALADVPRPLWRLIETVIVPYVIEGALGTRPFPY